MLTSPTTGADGAAALSAMPPDLDPTDAAALALRFYGVAGVATQLTSERDQNFLVRSDVGETWLLKISNPSEPDDVVAFQTAALDHVACVSPSTPVPRVLRTLDGQPDAALTLTDARQCRVRLLTYLEGVPVRGTERTAAQRRALGGALADLDLALAGFTHPAGAHDLLWNVAGADRLADRIDAVATGSRAALLRQFMDRFNREVKPRLGTLRAQMIHNDYHLFNVLVAAEDETHVTGIIDFGDMIHAPLVAEVATGAAYQLRGADDPLGAAATFVAGYHAVLPLEPAQQEILADLMATRHLITVLISEWRVLRYPENRDYILRHNGESWDALHLMADMPRATLMDRLLSGIETGDLR